MEKQLINEEEFISVNSLSSDLLPDNNGMIEDGRLLVLFRENLRREDKNLAFEDVGQHNFKYDNDPKVPALRKFQTSDLVIFVDDLDHGYKTKILKRRWGNRGVVE